MHNVIPQFDITFSSSQLNTHLTIRIACPTIGDALQLANKIMQVSAINGHGVIGFKSHEKNDFAISIAPVDRYAEILAAKEVEKDGFTAH